MSTNDNRAPKQHRSPNQIARDRRAIADLYLQGKLQIEIASMLGISQSTVSRDLQSLQQIWQQQAAKEVGQHLAEELAKIDSLERTYWQSWEESKKPREITATQQREGGRRGGDEDAPGWQENTTSIRQETRLGDPRYLEGVRWCIERRCKLLGVDAPSKVAPVTPDGAHPWAGQVVLYLPDNGRPPAEEVAANDEAASNPSSPAAT